MRTPQSAACAAVIAVLVLVWMPGTALGDYEQAKEGAGFAHFGVGGEAEQLRKANAMAINATGAGGVEPGSIYVVGYNERVLRYGPGKEGEEPPFREAWGWGVWNKAAEFQRCGPAVAGQEHCLPHEGALVGGRGGEEIGHFEALGGVAVDQATGDVYVLNEHGGGGARQNHLVEAFSATGTPIGEGFGEAGRELPLPRESIAEGPAKLHEINFIEEDGLAVSEAGVVYLTDRDYEHIPSPPGVSRAMCFKPQSPGDFEHYEYCGQSKDITIPQETSTRFTRLALLGGGKIIAAAKGRIREYSLAGGAPLCSFEVPEGNLWALAADPATGESFYFSASNFRLHRLSACDEATGEFEELQQGVLAKPKTDEIEALAFNPALSWGALRPAGTLYAADGAESRPGHGIGDVFIPAKLIGSSVLSQSATNTTTSSTTLEAEIDPHNFTVEYRFQYLPETTYQAQKAQAEGEGKSVEEVKEAAFAGALEAPAGGGTLGGAAVGSAAAGIGGLSSDTAYAFRAIAESHCAGPLQAPCVTRGEATFFATYPPASPAPPDGRAYELVSPAEKHGGEVFPAFGRTGSCVECKPPGNLITVVFPMQSAPNGDSVTYMGYPFSPEEGAAVFNDYLSKRGASGWQTTALSPALQSTKHGASVSFDTSLGHSLILQAAPPALSPAAPGGYPNLYLQGTSSPAGLAPLLTLAPPHRNEAGFKLEYAGHSADFTRQYFEANDSLTAATPFAPEPPDPTSAGRDLYESHDGSLALVNVATNNASVLAGAAFASESPDANAISEGGDRVFFSAGSAVYVREGGQLTRQLAHPGTFLAATPSGSEVLFADGCLYSLSGESCLDLTQTKGGFQGIAGASEGFDRIYFVDTAALPGSGQNERNESAQTSQPNLYLYEAGSPTRFVATLLENDNLSGEGDWAANPTRRTAEASPSGRYLAFASTRALTGAANVGLCKLEGTGEYVKAACNEAFLYDSATGHLACASCKPTGEAPLGPTTLRTIDASPEFLPQPRYVTDSGRLLFDSQDRLSPLDTNGRVEDVYEFEPSGVGDCKRAAGCISLISPGTGAVDSNLLAMDETGSNVFFTSRERLAQKDTDELIDVYDARIGGGFAGETETQRAECLGESCQAAPQPPEEVTPASAGPPLAGNLIEGQPGAPKPKKPKHRAHRRRHRKATHRKGGLK